MKPPGVLWKRYIDGVFAVDHKLILILATEKRNEFTEQAN